MVKVLGLLWDTQNDLLVVDLTKMKYQSGPPTKREAISLLGQIFDPIGFLTQLTAKIKFFYQKL